MKYGIWRSLAAVQRYLSHLVVACPAAYVFFGWMLPPPPPSRHGSASPAAASSPHARASASRTRWLRCFVYRSNIATHLACYLLWFSCRSH